MRLSDRFFDLIWNNLVTFLSAVPRPKGRAIIMRMTRSRHHRLAAFLPFIALAMALPTSGQSQSTSYQERDLLSRIRRLTVEGRRAGEGYWSPDGRRLIFQSEREPGNPFYQIYSLDLTSGD